MVQQIFSQYSTSISELRKHPIKTIEEAGNNVVAVLNRNKPAFYCVPPHLYEYMLDLIDDENIKKIIAARKNEEIMEVDISDL
jgi:antitoxin StbD